MANAFLDRVSNKALGEMLVEKGKLSEAQVKEALEVSREKEIRLGEALVSLGYLTRDALGYAIGEQYGLTPMELHPSMVDIDLVSRFDFNLLSAHTILPLIEIENDLVVVVSDPNDQQGLLALARQLPNYVITPQLGTAEQIRRCLEAVRPHVSQGTPLPDVAQATVGLSRELAQFEAAPAPGSSRFVEWLMGQAVRNSHRDVIVRDFEDSLQVTLTPSSATTNESVDAAHTELGRWQGASTALVRNALLQRAVPMEHTRGQAARWIHPLTFESCVFEVLVLMPILHGQPIIRLRALCQLDSDEGDTIFPLLPNLEAGRYTVVLYDESVRLEQALAQFIKENADRHSFLVCQHATRCVYPHVHSFPAPFVNIVAAAQATAATCVIFDHPVEYREAARLLTSTYPPPAVLVCAPLPSHESGAGSLSPDVEELINRQGAQSVRLMEAAAHSDTRTNAGGND